MTAPNPDSTVMTPFEQLRFRTLLIWLAIGLLVTMYLTTSLLPSLGVDKTDPLNAYVSIGSIYILVGVWMAVSFRRIGIDQQKLFGEPPNALYMRFSLGIVATMMFLSMALISLLYVRLAPIEPVSPTGETPMAMGETAFPHAINALSVIVLVVLGPIVEEVLFRGVLLHRWAARWTPRNAIFYSSLLFGVFHLDDMIGKFIFGYLMARLYMRSRSLHAPIFCHMLYNGVAVVLGFTGIGALSGNATAIFGMLRDKPWIGLCCLAMSFPLVLYYLHELETPPDAPLPYDGPLEMDDPSR